MSAVRYRTGSSTRTGKLLRGWPHCAQSLSKIWMTRLNTRVMLLDFGAELFSRLSEDITPDLALQIYDDLTTAAHTWEPEYRVDTMQVVYVTRVGALGLRHSGTYFPEGRLGNYEIAQAVSETTSLTRRLAEGSAVA